MANNRIPFAEVQALVRLILEAFSNQYSRAVDRNQIVYQFIPARVSTKMGFEISLSAPNETLKIRLYASGYTVSPGVNPFKLEENQNQPGVLGEEVFVSISDLPLGIFPMLSKTTNPVYDNTAPLEALELEDLSGYITTEDDQYITTELGP